MPSLTPYSGTLSHEQAAHLLRRVSLGPTQADINAITGMTASAAVDMLYAQAEPNPFPPIDPASGATFINREELNGGTISGVLRAYTRFWWLKQMIESSSPVWEKMTLFLHTHFTSSEEKVGLGFPLYHQNALFRKYALGNFKALAKKVCRDYTMSVFLDGWTNSVEEPNENFAREFLELYTIGKGPQIGPGNYTTYTENDVREAARVLTGYIPWGFVEDVQIPAGFAPEFDSDTGLFMSSIVTFLHDLLPKQFSSAFQNTLIPGGLTVSAIEGELDAFIDMIFNQSATASHICRKLYRFFVYYDITPDIETDIIQPLATTFQNSGYDLVPVLKQLMKSEHFFDADDAVLSNNSLGAIVKSPMDLIVGTFSYFNISIGDTNDWLTHYSALALLDAFGNTMDMTLFQPPEVAGYPAFHQAPFYNRNWLSASTLVNRYQGMAALMFGIPVNNGALVVKLDSVHFVETSGYFTNPGDPNELVDTLIADLFPQGIGPMKRDTLKNSLTDGDPDAYWTQTWNAYIAGGSDATARFRLDSLFNAILQSPEYQLS